MGCHLLPAEQLKLLPINDTKALAFLQPVETRTQCNSYNNRAKLSILILQLAVERSAFSLPILECMELLHESCCLWGVPFQSQDLRDCFCSAQTIVPLIAPQMVDRLCGGAQSQDREPFQVGAPVVDLVRFLPGPFKKNEILDPGESSGRFTFTDREHEDCICRRQCREQPGVGICSFPKDALTGCSQDLGHGS